MPAGQQRSRETIARVLDAALACVREHGVNGITLREVAARSHTSTGSIYHHFGSIEGVSAALYGRCLSRLLDAIIAAIDKGGSAPHGVRTVVVTYLDWVQAHAHEARFIYAAAYANYVPELAEPITAAIESRQQTILAWFWPHVQAGTIVELPAFIYEMVVIGPVAETARRWLAGNPEIDLEAARRELPERIWQALCPVVALS